MALALAPGVGPRRYHERTKGFGSAAHAFGATVPASSQSRLRDEALRLMAEGERRGARLLLIEDADYPARLLDLGDPPPFLFVLGVFDSYFEQPDVTALIMILALVALEGPPAVSAARAEG